MNATTWKYHPRRSPRKRRKSIAARLCEASIDFYVEALDDLLITDDAFLRAFMGTA